MRTEEILQQVEESTEKLVSSMNFTLSSEEFSEAVMKGLRKSHRTLQQTFWNTMFQSIKKYGDEYYDPRNQAAVETCKEISDTNPLDTLPHI